MLADYHVHTTHCDGKSCAEEMVQRAIELGVSELGFSGHGYTPHDGRYCMTVEGQEQYRSEIAELRRRYGNKIKIRCGVEQDLFGIPSPWADFRIGSVHYMKIEDEYVDVDESADKLCRAAEKYFGGDMLSLCEVYFKYVGRVAEELHPDIIGHFDLITKFNEQKKLFDVNDLRYIKAWQNAVDKLIPHGIPFEINLGAIIRGYRSTPYPSAEQIKYIASHGGRFIMSSDSHSAETLCADFSKWREWAEALGAEIIERL